MSRTLFWYVFKDLLKIFFLASAGLAGIMSFGGLLRPVTEHGLDSSQVGQILLYFMPAMTTYSLPIAALFATTMVYGRLSSDNEITACRASGISFLSMAAPALVLGLIVALISLLFLCFIVPIFSLKVEQVIYSNMAKIIANRIERTHQIKDEGLTIFAQRAYLPPKEQVRLGEQVVTLIGPLIVNYHENEQGERVPSDFLIAKQATAYVTRDPNSDNFIIQGTLEGGMKFPRELRGAVQGGIASQDFGPFRRESPVKEDPKFMDLNRLKELNGDKDKSRRVQEHLSRYIEKDQVTEYLRNVQQSLRRRGSVTLSTPGETESIVVHNSDDLMRIDGRKLIIGGPDPQKPRPLRMRLQREGTLVSDAQAQEIHITTRPDRGSDEMVVTVELYDAIIRAAGQAVGDKAKAYTIRVPMSADIRKIESRDVDFYLRQPRYQDDYLQRVVIQLSNGIHSELHGRASFAVSCLMLVMIGCSLGLMFRSGNLLSAFTVSVIPALICLTLIATGQQICENVPMRNIREFENPLKIGLGVIWSGNVAVAAIASWMMWRLQRQ